MLTPIRVLIVEDRPADAELMLYELRAAGFAPQWQRVETEQDYLAALDSAPAIILSDYNLPQFDAERALNLLRERAQDIPFIIVSGSIGEDVAVAAMHAGANDYLLKDRLARLGSAVTQALEQRSARRAKRLADNQLRVLLERLPAGAYTCDRDGLITFCNQQAVEIWGRAPKLNDPADRFCGSFRLFSPDGDPLAHEQCGMALTLRLNKEFLGQEIVIEQPSGKRLTVLAHASPMRNESGEIVGAVNVLVDITERKRVEEMLADRTRKLVESESRLQAIVDTVVDAIIVIGENGRIQSFNRSAESIFGYAAAEVTGKNVHILMPPPYHEEHDRYLRNYLDTGVKKIIGIGREAEGRRKDGSTFPLELAVSETRVDGHRLFTGVVRDISARKRLEEQFRQAQKMEAVGRLSAGVAHDFNNLLGVISGYTGILLRNDRIDEKTTTSLVEIDKAADRAASLTRQLLAFSRKQVLAPTALNLNELVLNIEKMLKRLVGEDVQLHCTLDKTIGPVLADPGQMEQVIMNLAVNARDAMPQGGKLTIETAHAYLDEASAGLHPDVKPGSYVVLTVSDTGCGLDANAKTHLFEPFFTTKGPGSGTGLGLATVYGIIKQSEGHISVHSEQGLGASFKIYLPQVDDVVTSQAAPADLPKPSVGSETILLVEDEDSLRVMAQLVLEECGYTVLPASSGAEAIRTCDQHKGPIDLVVTDVIMPEMGGRALGERLTAMRPGIKVLYVSGYTDDAVIRHGVLHAEVNFLQKPFSATTLADKVRSVLG